jgi:hypothetical protein
MITSAMLGRRAMKPSGVRGRALESQRSNA